MPIRDYLFDIAKIIEGAINGDQDKIIAYANQLSDRLESEGEAEGARRIRQIVSKRKTRTVGLARASKQSASDTAAMLIPVDSESRLPTGDEAHFEKGRVDLFVTPQVERTINQFLIYYGEAERLNANGVGVSPSMLVYGPPGCGKSQLAKFIASELGLPLITSRVDGLISSYLGSTSKNLRLLFEYAMSHPSILFLDEFDALAKMRDDRGELGELKRVVIGLLQNIDAMGKDHVLIAATNHEHLLDPAIWRRFAYKIHLVEPESQIREKMLAKFLSQYSNSDLIELLTLLSEGMSGAQLKQIADDCIRAAVLSENPNVDLRAAVDVSLAIRTDVGQAPPEDVATVMKTVRGINPKKFTQARLAKIFGKSQPTTSRLLKEGAE